MTCTSEAENAVEFALSVTRRVDVQMERASMLVQRSDAKRSFVTRDIGGETLILPVTGRAADLESLYVLNPVASRIWELLRTPNSADAIAGIVADEFAVSPQVAAADTAEFLDALTARGLVQATDQSE